MCHDRSYNLKEVARHLDLHYMTVYRYVRSGRLAATRDGNVWLVTGADLAAFTGVGDHEHPHADEQWATSNGGVPRSLWLSRMAEALAVGDEPATWSTIERMLASGHDAEDALQTLADAVGVAASSSGPAAPYLAAATAHRAATQIGARFRRRGRSRGTVVIGTPDGEAHGTATSFLAVALRLRNLQVLELGTGASSAAFLDASKAADRLVAVALGVTTIENLDAVARVTAELRAELPEVTIVLGGQAVRNIDVANLAGADLWAETFDEIMPIIDGLIPRRKVVAAGR